MPLTKYPNGVSSFGVPVIGGEDIPATLLGDYWYVGSGTGNDGYTGKDPSVPFATLAKALTKCTANNMDVIVILPGHAETIATATALDLNVAGVQIVGLGTGSLRPTFTFSLAAATITISAANTLLRNCIITSSVADILVGVTITAANVTLDKCSFPEATAGDNIIQCIDIGASSCTINGCDRYSLDAETIGFIDITVSGANHVISNNVDVHTYGADVSQFITLGATEQVNFICAHNTLSIVGNNSAQTAGNLISGSGTASDGMVMFNLVSGVDTGGLLDTATLEFGHQENYMAGVTAKSGILLPEAGA